MRNGRLLGVMATRGLFSTTKLIPVPPAGCGETEEAKSEGAQALMDTLDCAADGLIGKVTGLRRRTPPRGLTVELRRRGEDHPGRGSSATAAKTSTSTSGQGADARSLYIRNAWPVVRHSVMQRRIL